MHMVTGLPEKKRVNTRAVRTFACDEGRRARGKIAPDSWSSSISTKISISSGSSLPFTRGSSLVSALSGFMVIAGSSFLIVASNLSISVNRGPLNPDGGCRRFFFCTSDKSVIHWLF